MNTLGTCGGEANNYECNPCDNIQCDAGGGTGAAFEYGKLRTGKCQGTTNGYTCTTPCTSCQIGDYAHTPCDGQTTDTVCKACRNLQCAVGEYRTGACLWCRKRDFSLQHYMGILRTIPRVNALTHVSVSITKAATKTIGVSLILF